MAAYFLITFLTLSVTAPLAHAVVKPGTKCSKLGDKQDYQGKTYTCVKSKGKLVWNKGVATPTSSTNSFTDDAADKAAADKAAADKKAAQEAVRVKLIVDKLALVCTSDSNCPLGSTGPGGGMVFYDAGSKKSWGRYLEAAKDDWKGGYSQAVFAPWCKKWNGDYTFGVKDVRPLNIYLTGEVSNPALKKTLGVEIGKGKANTDLMLAFCDDERSAAAMARAHKGGNKSDWYLPSKNELMALCKFMNKAENGTVTEKIWLMELYPKTRGCEMKPHYDPQDPYSYVLASSSEKNATQAWGYDFNYLDENTTISKDATHPILPVRAFSF